MTEKPHGACLLGAGVSHNWGGWLAKDVNEILLSCREVQENGVLKEAIRKFRDSAIFGFAM